MRTIQFFQGLRSFRFGTRSLVVGAFLVGIVTASGAGAFAAKTASTHFAATTFEKMGGDPQAVFEHIADKVIAKLDSKTGGLSGAQKEITDKISQMAGDKLNQIDPSAMLKDIKGKVVSAGLGKLDEINPQAIIDQVTKQIVTEVNAKIATIDLSKLATDVLGDAVKDVNLEKLVKDYLNSIDVEKIVRNVVNEKMGSSSSGGLLGSLLGGFVKHH